LEAYINNELIQPHFHTPHGEGISGRQLRRSCETGFIQKRSGYSEHGTSLNERLHNANRKKEDLIVTAIDFTNAFGSVSHEPILTTMQQRSFQNGHGGSWRTCATGHYR
jgi:hypothetical protein